METKAKLKNAKQVASLKMHIEYVLRLSAFVHT